MSRTYWVMNDAFYFRRNFSLPTPINRPFLPPNILNPLLTGILQSASPAPYPRSPTPVTDDGTTASGPACESSTIVFGLSKDETAVAHGL